MPPKAPLYLSHMLDAASLVEEFCMTRSEADLRSDKFFRSAVYYQLAIIGEALSKLRDVDPATAGKITDAPRIVGFRNQIIHGYAVLSDDVTWKIIKEKLPILRTELTTLLKDA